MAASIFEEALRRLLLHEGGYSNHPSDPGGPTKYGITLADVRRYIDASADAETVRALSVEQARAIYHARYWQALSCDRLPAGFDYALFDYGVNSGVARAARVAGSLVGTGGGTVLDAATIAAIGRADAKVLIGRLSDERLAFLRQLRTWPVFGRGWSRRVAEVREAALAMAASAQAQSELRPQISAPGKAVVPAARGRQAGSTGAIAAGGAVAAGKAHTAGAGPGAVLAVLAVAGLAAVLCWLFWRWRQGRRQLAVG